MKNKKDKRILRPECKKPIHIDDFGGVAKQPNGSVGMYHEKCLIPHLVKKGYFPWRNK